MEARLSCGSRGTKSASRIPLSRLPLCPRRIRLNEGGGKRLIRKLRKLDFITAGGAKEWKTEGERLTEEDGEREKDG